MIHVGDRIGEYTVTASLGAGGMATLHVGQRAGAAGFATEVAIKAIHADLADDPTFVRMFVEEALLASRIHHPNVVRVDQLIEADGAYFLVMEYVRGCALSHLLRALARRGRRVSPALAAWIAMQVADGLHAAHETRGEDGSALGVVHRDVSPQNVLLSDTGHVKLIDFGIAKAVGRERTAAGTIRGKLRYMSPEQAAAGVVDRRSDVYALGVVLWEMLTMRKLFDGEEPYDATASRGAALVSPRTWAPHVGIALESVVMTALAPDAAARFGTAQAMRRALATAQPDALSIGPDEMAALLDVVGARRDGAPEAKLEAATRTIDLATARPDVLTALTLPSGDQAIVAVPPARAHSKPVAFGALLLGVVSIAFVASPYVRRAMRPPTPPVSAASIRVAEPVRVMAPVASRAPVVPTAPVASGAPVVPVASGALVAPTSPGARGHRAHRHPHPLARTRDLPLVERFSY